MDPGVGSRQTGESHLLVLSWPHQTGLLPRLPVSPSAQVLRLETTLRVIQNLDVDVSREKEVTH